MYADGYRWKQSNAIERETKSLFCTFLNYCIENETSLKNFGKGYDCKQ